jgi:2-keto-4-pentenoate hydratase
MTENEHLAYLLREAEESKEAMDPLREIIGVEDIQKAYDIQAVNTQWKIDKGYVVTGKKIGLTSFAVQEQLGVDQPDYGILFDCMEIQNAELPFSELMQPKAEAEIAFRINQKLDGEVTMERLKAAIDYAVISIEVVGSRIADWNIRITDTVADNASASHYILGDVHVPLDEVDLVGCKMTMKKNGELVSEGTGKACMDNPLNAALWLAQTMSNQGNPLNPGEILLSGALGPMVVLEQGDFIEAEIEGLGTLSLNIT